MTAENYGTRLHRLERVFLRAPRYFMTTCTHNRRDILANASVHESFLRFAEQGPEHGAWVGDTSLCLITSMRSSQLTTRN
jgi:hypothetical protein